MPEKRFAGDDDAFAALVLRFLDGATSPDEDATLNAELREPGNRTRRDLYVSLCRQRGLLSETMTATASRRRPAPPPRPRAPWKLLVGTAAAILAGIAGFLLMSKDEPLPIAVVERAGGDVAKLFAGQGVETNGRGAVIRYDDGTRIELSPQTQVRSVEVAGGKRLFAARGSIVADVAKQPADQPMVIRTSEGEARVVGTKFTLAVRDGSTRLEVEKGRVRLTRLIDKKSAEVAAGQYAVTSAGEDPVARSLAAARIQSMVPNSWMSVPDSRMKSVVPDPTKHLGIRGQSGPVSVVNAWSGGALDTRRNRLVLWGGGFTSYYGNELYAFDVESLAWERLTDPSRAPSLGQQVNADGHPNARATYNGLAYIAHADRFFGLGGDLARPAGEKMVLADSPWTFDFATLKWSDRKASGSRPPTFVMNLCSYDPVTRKVWWAETNPGARGLYSYDYDANAWTKHSSDDAFGRYTSAVDTKRRNLVMVGEGKVVAYDLQIPDPVQETWKTTGGDAFVGSASPGLDYDPVADRIVGWAGGAVYALDPGTKAWTRYDAPGAPAATSNGQYETGTYGRWRYVPAVDAFILVTSIDENVHFFKLPK